MMSENIRFISRALKNVVRSVPLTTGKRKRERQRDCYMQWCHQKLREKKNDEFWHNSQHNESLRQMSIGRYSRFYSLHNSKWMNEINDFILNIILTRNKLLAMSPFRREINDQKITSSSIISNKSESTINTEVAVVVCMGKLFNEITHSIRFDTSAKCQIV